MFNSPRFVSSHFVLVPGEIKTTMTKSCYPTYILAKFLSFFFFHFQSTQSIHLPSAIHLASMENWQTDRCWSTTNNANYLSNSSSSSSPTRDNSTSLHGTTLPKNSLCMSWILNRQRIIANRAEEGETVGEDDVPGVPLSAAFIPKNWITCPCRSRPCIPALRFGTTFQNRSWDKFNAIYSWNTFQWHNRRGPQNAKICCWRNQFKFTKMVNSWVSGMDSIVNLCLSVAPLVTLNMLKSKVNFLCSFKLHVPSYDYLRILVHKC